MLSIGTAVVITVGITAAAVGIIVGITVVAVGITAAGIGAAAVGTAGGIVAVGCAGRSALTRDVVATLARGISSEADIQQAALTEPDL